ncbi:sialate O-acetylesterase [Arcticibacter tournemirensis]|uniref:Sialate O-acetylesterase n=1 Tax=Arcticibacter tournemirensis TaxID=699437 RepID=A0A4Q0ME11_9SPHI|nr:sialate O-acetylesterase [Arcticibacter tournemirensis]RXF71056.1 sialate O-acetylesterase [Arcticibacter tournemirensis]
MRVTTIFFVIAALLMLSKTQAEVVLPRVLGHNMVLQRNKPVCIWGTATVGEKISVMFAGQKKETVTDVTGKWKVLLDPMRTSSEGREMIVTGSNTIRLQNILVGEVWLCSGQSNMEFTMRKSSKMKRPGVEGQNPVDELQYAKNPSIRIFQVNRKELIKPDSLHRGWSIARDSALRVFSAPAYFFAKELYSRLHVPVGVISSAVPGSAIEPWIPAEAFNDHAFFINYKVQNDPGKFYTPMIHPLVPFAIKGFLWYQGETNCFLNERIEYTHKMEALIGRWRSDWNDKDLPFYYVQIAPFKYSESKDNKVTLNKESLPEFREAQAAALKIPNTAMIITTDLADNLSDIHPSYKWEVGRRLALLALARDYGFKEIVSTGPVYHGMKIKGNKIELSFSSVGGGLVSKDGKTLSDFLIAGKDKKFVPAQAEIKGNKVVVSSNAVNSPADVRFAWVETAQPNLYNKEGLPAQPFRTDNILTGQFKPDIKN